MSKTIINRLKDECISLAMAGKHADTGALAALLPELEALGRSSPAFLRATELAREVSEDRSDSLLALNRLVSSMSIVETGFGQSFDLTEIAGSRVPRSINQVSFRKLVEMRSALEAGNAATDRLLEELSGNPELFDPRLLPSLIPLAESGRVNTSRLARALLARIYSVPAPEHEHQAITRARDLLADGDIKNLIRSVREIADSAPVSKDTLNLMYEILLQLPKYKKHPSLERAVVCFIAGQKSPEALAALEDCLENIRDPRAVFSLAIEIHAPEKFYSRYFNELGECRERHYSEFRDAVICHIMLGGRVDNRWSDFFAERNDRLPTLMTVGPDSASAIRYLRSFAPAGHTLAPPSSAELLLNLVLIPQALLRMEIYDFWEELWEYLKAAISVCLKVGGGLPDAFFDERILFTLSLNGAWITDRLTELAEGGSACPQLTKFIELLCEKAICFT